MNYGIAAAVREIQAEVFDSIAYGVHVEFGDDYVETRQGDSRWRLEWRAVESEPERAEVHETEPEPPLTTREVFRLLVAGERLVDHMGDLVWLDEQGNLVWEDSTGVPCSYPWEALAEGFAGWTVRS